MHPNSGDWTYENAPTRDMSAEPEVGKTILRRDSEPPLSIDCQLNADGDDNGNEEQNGDDDDDGDEDEDSGRYIGGVLVTYTDDQLDDCVNLALKKKSRVKYRCMDTRGDHLAFGTSGGAIYLFKLDPFNRSLCALESMTPCDQGQVEVLRFLPHPQQSDLLLVAVGTSRGSLVLFKFHKTTTSGQLRGQTHGIQLDHLGAEIYRSESFTGGSAIKLIEFDYYQHDTFHRLYVCDDSNRIYVLERNSILQNGAGNKSNSGNLLIQRLSDGSKPSLVLHLKNTRDKSASAKINQLSVHKSMLLISSDDDCRLFNEQSRLLSPLGTRKRKEGFFGATFFNQAYKRQAGNSRQLQQQPAQQSPRSGSLSSIKSDSATSANQDDEYQQQQVLFVARPLFRLWQVNLEGAVICTHQFEQTLRGLRNREAVQLTTTIAAATTTTRPSADARQAREIGGLFGLDESGQLPAWNGTSGHFQKLVPIHTLTMGNLLLSYTKSEVFVLDPIGAELVCLLQLPIGQQIIQVSCSENELFVWSSKQQQQQQQYQEQSREQARFSVRRYVLMAPTQFVLELHRLQRPMSLISFVQLFCGMFKQRMAVPLSGRALITTEGGLLRNIMVSSWHNYEQQQQQEDDQQLEFEPQPECCHFASPDCFKALVEEILAESRQLQQSVEDIISSRLFFEMNNENMERLCSEPYTSLVSLRVSIADLHTKHVIQFDRNTINRHKSIANLSQGLQKVRESRRASSNQAVDLARSTGELSLAPPMALGRRPAQPKPNSRPIPLAFDSKVIVERQRPRKAKSKQAESPVALAPALSAAAGAAATSEGEQAAKLEQQLLQMPQARQVTSSAVSVAQRCPSCQWPRPAAHKLAKDANQTIQKKWIRDHLLADFELHLAQIERIAFKHALWKLYLKCLLQSERFDDFVDCCLMLDDVQLLNKLQLKGEPLMDLLFARLNNKLDICERLGLPASAQVCLQCSKELPQADHQPARASKMSEYIDYDDDDDNDDDLDEDREDQAERLALRAAVSFTLVNLLEQVLMKRCVSVHAIVARLLRNPKLVNEATIPASFYLKAIATAALIAKQSPVSSKRLNELQNGTE